MSKPSPEIMAAAAMLLGVDPGRLAMAIDAARAPKPTTTTPPRFVSQKAACAALGICRPTLLKMRQSGQLATVQVGSRVLIPQSALEALAAVKAEG